MGLGVIACWRRARYGAHAPPPQGQEAQHPWVLGRIEPTMCLVSCDRNQHQKAALTAPEERPRAGFDPSILHRHIGCPRGAGRAGRDTSRSVQRPVWARGAETVPPPLHPRFAPNLPSAAGSRGCAGVTRPTPQPGAVQSIGWTPRTCSHPQTALGAESEAKPRCGGVGSFLSQAPFLC